MNYKHTHIACENDASIDIFDNVFPSVWKNSAYEFVKNSLYRIGWADSLLEENRKYDENLHSAYTKTDLENFGIMEHINKVPELSDVISTMKVEKVIVNLSTQSDVNFIHTHCEKKVLLYYANLNWKDGAHGETQFWTEDNQSIQFTSPYVPGRLIMFDGRIPHTIRPQSQLGPKFRFTVAINLN